MNATLKNELERAARPIETATGLSNAFYIDDDVFKQPYNYIRTSERPCSDPSHVDYRRGNAGGWIPTFSGYCLYI